MYEIVTMAAIGWLGWWSGAFKGMLAAFLSPYQLHFRIYFSFIASSIVEIQVVLYSRKISICKLSPV